MRNGRQGPNEQRGKAAKTGAVVRMNLGLEPKVTACAPFSPFNVVGHVVGRSAWKPFPTFPFVLEHAMELARYVPLWARSMTARTSLIPGKRAIIDRAYSGAVDNTSVGFKVSRYDLVAFAIVSPWRSMSGSRLPSRIACCIILRASS